MNEAFRDLKVSWIIKLVQKLNYSNSKLIFFISFKKSRNNELYEKFLAENNENKEHVPLYINRIKYLEQQVSSTKDDVKLKIQYLTQIVELSKVALSKINQDELFIYFGIKKHEKANENLQK